MTGVYVIASEPVKIPWFDGIFADIGDEQSLTQSLSTFSGHLRQIGVSCGFVFLNTKIHSSGLFSYNFSLIFYV